MAALASAHVGVVLQEIGSQATLDAASAVLQSDIGERFPPRWCVLERRDVCHILPPFQASFPPLLCWRGGLPRSCSSMCANRD